ncbi:MAG: hypothetical protein U0V04_15325 [Spirosomataceae bacterium]|jgi:hypothetical protein
MNFKIIKIFVSFSLFLGCETVQNSEVELYCSFNKKLRSNFIFKEGDIYTFNNLRDSVGVKKKNGCILQREDDIYYNKIYQGEEEGNVKLIFLEASNSEMGRYSLDRNYNYDLLYKDGIFKLNLYFPEDSIVFLKFSPTVSQLDLLNFAFNQIRFTDDNDKKNTYFTNSIYLKGIDDNGTKISRFDKNYDNDLGLIYEVIKYIIIKNIVIDKNFELLKNKITVTTSDPYEIIRMGPTR